MVFFGKKSNVNLWRNTNKNTFIKYNYLVGKIPLLDFVISGRGFLFGECSFLKEIHMIHKRLTILQKSLASNLSQNIQILKFVSFKLGAF